MWKGAALSLDNLAKAVDSTFETAVKLPPRQCHGLLRVCTASIVSVAASFYDQALDAEESHRAAEAAAKEQQADMQCRRGGERPVAGPARCRYDCGRVG